jgi:hypothetical protein
VLRVVAVDLRHSGNSLFQIIETKQSTAGRKVIAKACIFGEHGQ